MPQKTRKEKQAALRHQNDLLERYSLHIPSHSEQEKDYTRKLNQNKVESTAEQSTVALPSHFLTDLRKSLTLIVLIIGIEFLIYYLNVSGMMNLINFPIGGR